jgi:hypothetical protein
MAKVVLTLEDEDLLALQQVMVDDDERAALEFLREHILPRLPRRSDRPCDSNRLNPYLPERDE